MTTSKQYHGSSYSYWVTEDGDFHKEDGPAIIYGNGTECWYYHGELHRIDGPAILSHNGPRWFIHGIEHTEKEFNFWSKTWDRDIK